MNSTNRLLAVRQFLISRLEPERLRFVSATVLLWCLVLLIISFATSDRGRTLFGPPLGADYTGFYTAATLINRSEADRLYDHDYQNELYHELLPNLPRDECIPYVHPPFVALALSPLARLPYEWSFAVWLLVSAGLYVVGLGPVWTALRASPVSHRLTILLLALSFEPFLMECWLGGQLSAFGFCCLALAWTLEQGDRPYVSGLALGMCLYKPTLLVLALPMTLLARKVWTGLGFLTSGAVLAGLSVLTVGLPGCLTYLHKLLGFAQTTTQTSHLVLRTWKYVDLNSFLRLLLGGPTSYQGILLLTVTALPMLFLMISWWKLPEADTSQRTLVWAATLSATLVLNLYVGVYDTILAVLAALLTTDVLWNRLHDAKTPLPFAYQVLLLLLYVTPWFTQPVARIARVQLITLVLFALAAYQLAWSQRLGSDGLANSIPEKLY